MGRGIIIIIVIGIIIVLGALFFIFNTSSDNQINSGNNLDQLIVNEEENSGSVSNNEVNEANDGESAGNTIEISDSGFSPSRLEINQGDRVTFINNGNAPSWPASAVHPTHKSYPGSDIAKCDSGEEIFDACKGLSKGESFSFTFNEVGEWRYHNHLNPSLTGVVVVR